ncbi:MAG: ATP synthase F0 subunit B [Desulfobacteraceae bacterium]|nr:ATP synthase F0 subunit B [Desulfobacteraceae bacterium]MBC2754293.1 ATP synthase F0 subunit B [Desulfobacteraceae bacterium]
MKNRIIFEKRLRNIFASFLFIHLMSSSAFASGPSWRPIYDEVMLWINFFILVFIIVKYGKKPLVNFLQGRKDEVADEIHRLQKQKNAIEAKIKKTQSIIEESSVRFDQIKSRIIEDGERSKQKMIEDAKAQSKNIIEVEKLKAKNHIVQAKDMFMSELVDEASTLALNRLPSEINDSDHNKLLDLFISNISEAPKQRA